MRPSKGGQALECREVRRRVQPGGGGGERPPGHGVDGSDVGTLSLEKQIGICLQVASGLLFLHQHDPQILHRDLTAKNVLMNKDGSIAKISDFGQAKFHPSTIKYLSTKAPGCLLYMPPQCWMGTDEKSGVKSRFTDKGDVFSLGVLLLQIATQEPPSVGLVIREGQPEVEHRAADLAKLPEDHPLRAIILQCFQDDPAERPSCLEVLRSCREILQQLFGSNVSYSEHMHSLQPHTVAVLSSSDVILHCSHTCTYTRYITQDSPHTSSGNYT